MFLTTEFCNSVIEEYSRRFTKDEIEKGYKGMNIQTAQIAMKVFRIAFKKLSHKESDSQVLD